MDSFAYGVSFNCMVGDLEIGGGAEGDTSLDYVSNDLEKLKAAVVVPHPVVIHGPTYKVITDHQLVIDEVEVSIGGEVVAVVVDEEDEDYIVAVIFKDPHGPTVIE